MFKKSLFICLNLTTLSLLAMEAPTSSGDQQVANLQSGGTPRRSEAPSFSNNYPSNRRNEAKPAPSSPPALVVPACQGQWDLHSPGLPSDNVTVTPEISPEKKEAQKMLTEISSQHYEILQSWTAINELIKKLENLPLTNPYQIAQVALAKSQLEEEQRNIKQRIKNIKNWIKANKEHIEKID